MANIDVLVPKILKWEGGFVNNPNDKGGPTNEGITLSTWKQVGYDKTGDGEINVDDIKILNEADFKFVLRIYWNRWKADSIQNQSIADILVDWVWGSGKWGVVIPQELLGVETDGVVGRDTITAVNSANQEQLFNKIFQARVSFLQAIVKHHPSQSIFLKGWLNRLNDFKFNP